MISGIRTQKKNQAEQYIKKHALLLKPGEAMPPIRSLMKGCGLGRNAVEAAVRQLITDRLLEARERSGIYRTEINDCSASVRVVDIVACSEIGYLSNPVGFFPDLVEKLTTEATRRGYSIRIHRVKLDAMLTEYGSLIEREKIRNAILISPHTNEIVKIFDQAKINWLMLFPRYLPSSGPAINDSPDAVPMQIRHLLELGHRRIAFIEEVEPEAPAMIHLLRRESYYRMMAENGLRIMPEWVVPCTNNEKTLFAYLDRMFAATTPTALICPDIFMPSVYRYFNRQGLTIGRDISIIGFDGMEHSSLHPRPTTLINSRQVIAAMTWETLEKIIGGEKINSIRTVPLRFSPGESTGQSIGK